MQSCWVWCSRLLAPSSKETSRSARTAKSALLSSARRRGAVFWLHGTPGARRQIPTEARLYAENHNVRLIGIDRPGIGSSTPHRYKNIAAFADDLQAIADTLGVDKMAVVGLSGGGPYALACAAGLPDRVVDVGVLGGVAPTRGPDAISGGAMNLGLRVAPLLRFGGAPLRVGASMLVQSIRPVASPALYAYAAVSPQADRHLLTRPEFKAMFLDDLLNGSRKQLDAPFNDIMLFARDWGFGLDEVKVPVRWWHGDTTTSFRSPTGSTSSRGCPTPSCSTCRKKVIWPGWAAARRSCPP
jgi:pimeloyl-ACP methyl ester carboxylesterase